MYNYNIDWFSVTISSKAIFLFLSDCIFRTGFCWNNWSSRIFGRQRKGGMSDHYYLRNSLIYVTARFNPFNFVVGVFIKPWGCSKKYYLHRFCFTLSHVLYAHKFTSAIFQQRPNFLSEVFFPEMRRQKPVEDSHKKRTVCSSEILKRTPTRNQDPVLWARLEIFSPQEITRGTNSKATHNLISYFYGSIPQRYLKASTVDRVGLNTLKGTENRFFNP